MNTQETPQETAKELVEKLGKKDALIHADEVVKIEQEWKRKCLSGETTIKYDAREQSILNHWESIKLEIGKIK